jgi:nucleoside-diphosphate-sugar epimerase
MKVLVAGATGVIGASLVPQLGDTHGHRDPGPDQPQDDGARLRAPAALVRIAAGAWGAAFMTELRGASNARAKAALGWQPTFPSWIEGFRAEHGLTI